MTIPDEITMVEGQGTTNPYVFYMAGIPSLCIPSLGEEDGPNGVADGLTDVTQLPAGVALAATFDPSLAGQYGQVIGSEEVGKGASVNLGPTVNIDCDPRWGRSVFPSKRLVNVIVSVQTAGRVTWPRNSGRPVAVSMMANRKGRSTTIQIGSGSRRRAIGRIPIAVAAAASVPCSSTSM